MEKGFCERCGGQNFFTDENGRSVPMVCLPYCVECSKDLCDECMKRGCCGNVPAINGDEDDE